MTDSNTTRADRNNQVCPACACLCDDLKIRTEGDSIRILSTACPQVLQWFENDFSQSQAQIGDDLVSLDAAINAAAKMLSGSRSPLICGLDSLTTESQQAAFRLAKSTRATIDTTLDPRNRSGLFSLQSVGKVTATLGEVRQRSDVIVFWFCDPVSTHERLLERFLPTSDKIKRRIIVVDEHPTKTARLADQFIQLKPTFANSAICILRCLLQGHQVDAVDAFHQTNIDLETWTQLLDQITSSGHVAFFTGKTTPHSQFDIAGESLAAWIRKLNDQTCCVSLSLRADGNAQSAENVLAWNSGFPAAVNLHRPNARSFWMESAAATILSRSEADLILFATHGSFSQAMDSLPKVARQNIESLPKILLSSVPREPTEANVAIRIPVARPALDDKGDYCRLDDVALPTQKIAKASKRPSAQQIFKKLESAIRSYEKKISEI